MFINYIKILNPIEAGGKEIRLAYEKFKVLASLLLWLDNKNEPVKSKCGFALKYGNVCWTVTIIIALLQPP